jgi:ferritin-like metal-binding protein YciE
MPDNNLRELYISELQDLYDAENQLIDALPKMAAASDSPKLRAGLKRTCNRHGDMPNVWSASSNN